MQNWWTHLLVHCLRYWLSNPSFQVFCPIKITEKILYVFFPHALWFCSVLFRAPNHTVNLCENYFFSVFNIIQPLKRWRNQIYPKFHQKLKEQEIGFIIWEAYTHSWVIPLEVKLRQRYFFEVPQIILMLNNHLGLYLFLIFPEYS